MKNAIKLFSLVLILAVSGLSLMITKPAAAQISKPSVPEFSIKVIDYSETKAIELSIKNQPFTPYTDNGQAISLYYNVHFKLHNSASWTAMYYCGDVFPTHSDSDYIRLVYPLQLASSSGSSYYLLKEVAGYYYILLEIPFNEQMDFRVQAMEGILTSSSFTGQTSDWSNVQTLTIPRESTSPSPDPTPTMTPPTPDTPDSSWIVIWPLLAVVLLGVIILMVKVRKRK